MKMKHYIYALLFGLLPLIASKGFAQDGDMTCGFNPDVHSITANMGTETGPQRCQLHPCDAPFNRDAAIYNNNNGVLKVHLLVHLIRDTYGNGPTLQEVEDMLIKTRNDFRGISADTLSAQQNMGWQPGAFDTGIDFCWSVKVVENNYLYTASSSTVATQLNEYPNHQVNVILNANPNSAGAQGLALSNPNGTNPRAHVWVHHSHVTGYNKTLAHELGHYFGLYHTFDNQGCGPCQENMLLTGAQRDTMGDRCSDTDPSNSFNGCSTPTQIELCSGLPFSQQFLNNIMSYSWPACGVSFTPQQGGRMRCYLQSNYQTMLSFLQSGCPEIPLADFSINPSNSCPGTQIQFTDESWNSIGWLWDFGDGSTSTLPSPTHAYSQTGSYTVSLTVLSSTGLTHTKTVTNAVGISGGVALPYTFKFNQNPSVQNGWTAVQDPRYSPDMAKWRRMSSLSFVPNAPVSGAMLFTAATHSMGNGAFYYNNCFIPNDPGLRYVTGPTGPADTSCFFLSSKSPYNGQYDALVSPPFDFSSVQNPKMSFYFSHLPAGTDQPGMTCDWSFPGLSSASLPYGNPRNPNSPNIQPGHPCYQTTCPGNNPNCNRTNWGVGEILNDSLKVHVSTDCGYSWTQIWIGNGENLNTVPNEVCAPTVYVPRATSVWRKLEFDLCAYIGEPNVQFKITYVQDKYAGNMYVDEFQVGSDPNATLTIQTQATGDCGLGTGSVLATAQNGTQPYVFGLSSPFAAQPLTNGTGAFQNLTAGTYGVSVQDAAGNCAKAPVQVALVPALTTTYQAVGASCGNSNGNATVNVQPSSATQFTYSVRNNFGQVVVPQTTVGSASFQVSGLAAGTFVIDLTDNLGNCGVDTIVIPVLNSLSPQVSAFDDQCNSGNGSIVFYSPSGTGTTFELRHLATGQMFSNTTGSFYGMMTGTYRACATYNGNCGCETVTINPGSALSYSKSLINETCFSANGEIQVTLPNSISPGMYTYELFLNSMLSQSSTSSSNSHSFTGLSAGNYTIRATDGLNGGCVTFTASIYHSNTLPIDVMPIEGWCGSFMGELFVQNFLTNTVNYTVSNQQGVVMSGTQTGFQYSLTGLMPGPYFVSFVDSSGACFADSVEIPYFATLGFSSNGQDASCGMQDGRIDVDLSINGASQYTLIIANADSSYIDTLSGAGPVFSFTQLPAGSYSFSGQDTFGACFLGTEWIAETVGCCAVPTADIQLVNSDSYDFANLSNYAGMATGLEIHVVDTFWINGDLNFDNCIFWMDSSAVISILPGYILTIDNSQIKAACNYMWDGIHITHEKAILNLDSCFVSDGENAVQSMNGGKYNISNTSFSNNWIGLSLKNHGGPHLGTFKSSTITSDPAAMMDPHASEYAEVGIWVEFVDSVNIGKADIGDENTISNVAVGIYSDRADLRVVNTRIEDVKTKLSNKPVPFSNAYGTGIYATGLAGSNPAWLYTLSVGDADTSLASCNISRMKYGVKVENNMHVAIEENTVENAMIGLLMQKNNSNLMGVNGNMIINCLTGVRGLMYAGSDLNVEDNIFVTDAAHAGSAINLSDVNILNLGQAGRTLVKGNSIDAYGFGITASATGRLSITQNSVRMHGNYPYFGWGAGIHLQGCDSAQVIENQVESTAMYADSVTGIRSVLSSQVKLSCNELTGCNQGMHFYGPNNLANVTFNTMNGGKYGMVLENNGLIGTQGTGAVPAGNKWIGTWACTNLSAMVLSKNTNAGQHAYYARTSAQEKPSTACNLAINGSPVQIVPITTYKSASCNQASPITHDMARQAWEEIMTDGREYEVFTDMTRFLDQEFATSLLLNHAIDSVATDFKPDAGFSENLNRLQLIQGMINGRPVDKLPLAKQESDAMTALAGYSTVVNAQAEGKYSEELTALANGCPLVAGRAVFQARAIQAIQNPNLLHDDGICPTTQEPAQAQSVQAAAQVAMLIEAFPNPTMDKMQVRSPQNGTARILSSTGVLIETLQINLGNTTIDMGGLPAGVYFLEYVLERGGHGTTKLVKI